MVGIDAFNQRNGLRKDGDITFQDALYHLSSRIFMAAETPTFQVRVHDALAGDASIDLQPFVFFAILGMIHILN